MNVRLGLLVSLSHSNAANSAYQFNCQLLCQPVVFFLSQLVGEPLVHVVFVAWFWRDCLRISDELVMTLLGRTGARQGNKTATACDVCHAVVVLFLCLPWSISSIADLVSLFDPVLSVLLLLTSRRHHRLKGLPETSRCQERGSSPGEINHEALILTQNFSVRLRASWLISPFLCDASREDFLASSALRSWQLTNWTQKSTTIFRTTTLSSSRVPRQLL